MKRACIAALWCATFGLAASAVLAESTAPRHMEALDRGVVAVPAGDGKVLVSCACSATSLTRWRLT
ncbi:MAG: hypothetical protein QM770_24090 [Tepidisphaeraceae bacterium]